MFFAKYFPYRIVLWEQTTLLSRAQESNVVSILTAETNNISGNLTGFKRCYVETIHRVVWLLQVSLLALIINVIPNLRTFSRLGPRPLLSLMQSHFHKIPCQKMLISFQLLQRQVALPQAALEVAMHQGPIPALVLSMSWLILLTALQIGLHLYLVVVLPVVRVVMVWNHLLPVLNKRLVLLILKCQP